MEEPMDTLPETTTRQEKHVRITQHGKMKSWIAASLQFFDTSEAEKSLTLHTLPHLAKAPTDPENPAETETTPGVTPHTASLVTSVVPRLISVVEILKREYMKLLESTKSARVIGLHQYNEIGTLEELGIIVDRTEEGIEGNGDGERKNDFSVAEARRSKEILGALSGKNHPKQYQTPFMRVTLSTVERPDLLAKGASYQPPAIRRQSKAAKARAKKQRAKAKRAMDVAVTDAKTA